MSRAEDLSGKIFGYLTVLKRVPSVNGKNARFLCRCVCETEKEIDATLLRTGKVVSCGCKRTQAAKKTAKDISNQKFGKLIAIHPVEERVSYCNSVCWYCECECGGNKIVPAYYLTTEKTRSCGCLKKESAAKVCAEINMKLAIGDKIGKLTIIEKTDKRIRTRIIWKCICDCEKQTEIEVSSNYLLRKGLIPSCGCLKDSIGEINIMEVLDENNITYIRDYTFPNLLTDKSNALKFDFAIFKDSKLDCVIEFDGIQHQYNTWNKSKEDFERYQLHDKMRNEYCLHNNIPFIRIPYTKRDVITIDMLLPKTSEYLVRGESNVV